MLVPYTRRTPFAVLDRDLDKLFRGIGAPAVMNRTNVAGWAPAVDIKENEESILLLADLPGVDIEDIDVTVEDGFLTISGSRTQETTQEKEHFRRVERSYGSFTRRFALPDVADVEHISAESKQGVLHVCIPKKESAKPRKISIN